MRKLLLWGCCCFSVLLTCLSWVTAVKDENDVRLRVSVRKDILKRVPSCQHTFSQVELLNLHATDPIVIHSIQTAPEETILVGGSESWDDDMIPQQLHVSRLPAGSLTLGPGQVAIVPVTFLPRYPMNEDYFKSETNAPTLSPTALADLAEFVGEEVVFLRERKRRNNLNPTIYDDEYEVSTTIVVDTSRGVVKLPVYASSVRDNQYHLPDIIYFQENREVQARKPEVAVLNSDDAGGHESLEINQTMPKDRNCFDIFLSNPSSENDLELLEILISRPDLVSVEVDTSILQPHPPGLRSSSPSQVIREWTDVGPLTIAPGAKQDYVATVCLAPDGVPHDESTDMYLEEMANWIDSGNPERSLGYLQIRTGSETLFVGLEKADKHRGNQQNANRAKTETGANRTSSSFFESFFPDKGSITAIPTSIDFRVLTSAHPSSSAALGIQNLSPHPLRIMRVAAGLDTGPNEDFAKMADRIGLDVSVRIVKRANDSSPVFVPAESSVDSAVVVTCQVTGDDASFQTLSDDAVQFTGTILVRGTSDLRISFGEWREEMKINPHRDAQYVLEVPYSVTVVNGKIEILLENGPNFPRLVHERTFNQTSKSLTALFFPSEQRNLFPGKRKNYFENEMQYSLRIVSNMAVPMSLSAVDIWDGNSVDSEYTDSLCERFNVSKHPDPLGLDFGGTDADYVNLGIISLNYSFSAASTDGRHGYQGRKHDVDKSGSSEPFPQSCFLSVTTKPIDTGIHVLPLVVYSGQLDVNDLNGLPSQPRSSDSDESDLMQGAPSSAVMGFDRLLSWFRSSAAGISLIDLLESMGVGEGKKRTNRDAHLLGRYLFSLCHRSYGVESLTMRPILLQVGAIEQDEMELSPLYLTNHNPVPLGVSVEVGEVEGLSIHLARDPIRARGDGNSMLDYLPGKMMASSSATDFLQSSKRSTLISSGDWHGHPISGLRQFLLNSETASGLSSSLPFRDAVSPSSLAAVRQPMLESLYKKYAVAEFHRDALPSRFSPRAWSLCDSTLHPPLYGPLNATAKQRKTVPRPLGPLIISKDGSILHSLPTCWERDSEPDEMASDGTTVVIPPGGVARFEVRVRAPPEETLSSDITPLLATGLVLSTNHGEILPIVVSFEALQGQLRLSSATSDEPASSYVEDGEVKVISVPLRLFHENSWPNTRSNSTSLIIPPAGHSTFMSQVQPLVETDKEIADSSVNDAVPLYLRSSFSRDVRLRQIESCNPWFEVKLLHATSNFDHDPRMGVKIGAIQSVVSCSADMTRNSSCFPSFYQCALNWLTKRSELQPRGCGLLPIPRGRSGEEGGVDAADDGVSRAVRALERSLQLLDVAYLPGHSAREEPSRIPHRGGNEYVNRQCLTAESVAVKSNTKRSDGYVSSMVLDVFSEAWDAWKFVTGLGLSAVSSSLRATIEYKSVGSERKYDSFASPTRKFPIPRSSGSQSLSMSLHNVAVETSLVMPRLFDFRRAKAKALLAEPSEDQAFSIVEFPPTLVATVASITLPLKNPTAVPVRVRVAVAPPRPTGKGEDRQFDHTEEGTRSRFTKDFDEPYVQNGHTETTEQNAIEKLWWDGGGSFFLSDDRGDLIRSHHNVTIRAGAGAHVSLVNPSLHTTSAFILGCGSRCGIRDDPTTSKNGESKEDPKDTSIIGASAAAGIALLGRKRSHLPQVNAMGMDEPIFGPGGAPSPELKGLSAFAIPYSALDEIVIPPFGEGEIGPIFFRPPGRFSILGCESAIESSTTQWGIKASRECAERAFKSMILLENSLTGLERIQLRGKGMWERVQFLDPEPECGSDSFGDIELRNGRQTLMFSGSSLAHKDGRRPVVKEVVVHNGGDVAVSFASVYLSDTIKVSQKLSAKVSGGKNACTSGSFRLLGCWSSEQETIDIQGEKVPNIGSGFVLLPGENRSLFVEHRPDCTKREEFVSLNLDYRRDGASGSSIDDDNSVLSLSRTGELRNAKANTWRRSFRQQKIDLMVGYQFSDEAFSSCLPIGSGSLSGISYNAFLKSSYANRSEDTSGTCVSRSPDWILSGPGIDMDPPDYRGVAIDFVFWSVMLLTVAFVTMQSCRARIEASKSFARTLQGPQIRGGSDIAPPRHGGHSNWSAAFRCLARADPTSSELQALGREQIRQVALARYRTHGVLPPQCFNANGVLVRERGRGAGSAHRQSNGKESTAGGNERARTLSDALFQDFLRNGTAPGTGRLPTGLGWRGAFARGIITDSCLDGSSVGSKSRDLLLLRQRNTEVVKESSEPEVEPEPVSKEDVPHGTGNQDNEKAEGAEDHDVNRVSLDSSEDVISTSESEETQPVKEDRHFFKEKDRSKLERVEEPATEPQPPVQPGPRVETSSTQVEANKDKETVRKKAEEKPTRESGKEQMSLQKSGEGVQKDEHRRGATNPAKASSRREKAKANTSNSGRNKDKQAIANPITATQSQKTEGSGKKKKQAKAERSGKNTPKQTEAKVPGPKHRSNGKSKATSGSPKPARKSTSKHSPSSPSTDSSPKITQKQTDLVFRPPPGLAPPPGFSPGNTDLPRSTVPSFPSTPSQLDKTLLKPNDLTPDASSGAKHDSRTATQVSPLVAGAPFTYSSAATGGRIDSASGIFPLEKREVPEQMVLTRQSSTGNSTDDTDIAGSSIVAMGTPGGAVGNIGLGSPVVASQQPSFLGSSSPREAVQAGLDSAAGFDVMNFLDGILDDGGTGATDENPAGGEDFLGAGTTGLLPLDPWATERQSRAAAYGISFEGDDQGSQKESSTYPALSGTSPTVSALPLDAVGAFLSSSGNEDDNEETGGSSFYASLLGE